MCFIAYIFFCNSPHPAPTILCLYAHRVASKVKYSYVHMKTQKGTFDLELKMPHATLYV